MKVTLSYLCSVGRTNGSCFVVDLCVVDLSEGVDGRRSDGYSVELTDGTTDGTKRSKRFEFCAKTRHPHFKLV